MYVTCTAASTSPAGNVNHRWFVDGRSTSGPLSVTSRSTRRSTRWSTCQSSQKLVSTRGSLVEEISRETSGSLVEELFCEDVGALVVGDDVGPLVGPLVGH
jgi:hypothetical protein